MKVLRMSEEDERFRFRGFLSWDVIRFEGPATGWWSEVVTASKWLTVLDPSNSCWKRWAAMSSSLDFSTALSMALRMWSTACFPGAKWLEELSMRDLSLSKCSTFRTSNFWVAISFALRVSRVERSCWLIRCRLEMADSKLERTSLILLLMLSVSFSMLTVVWTCSQVRRAAVPHVKHQLRILSKWNLNQDSKL